MTFLNYIFIPTIICLIYPLWITRLNFTTNIINLIDLFSSNFKQDFSLIQDNEIEKIKKLRYEFELLPKGFNSIIKLKHQINITSQQKDSNHDIPLHIYIPNECDQNCPIIIYVHGGGFVVGSSLSYEHITTTLAFKTGHIVISIDYRMAPENKFPAAPKDCIEATEWIYTNGKELFNGDINKITIIGDSAGGNLAGIVTKHLPQIIKFSILIYPTTSFGVMVESYIKYSNAPVLTSKKMHWYVNRYFNNPNEFIHPLACPHCDVEDYSYNNLKLPRIHVITAEIDVLHDEGELYYNALNKDNKYNNYISYKCYENAIHGFFGIPFLQHGINSMNDVVLLIIDHFQ
jgi:acetyl esterase